MLLLTENLIVVFTSLEDYCGSDENIYSKKVKHKFRIPYVLHEFLINEEGQNECSERARS